MASNMANVNFVKLDAQTIPSVPSSSGKSLNMRWFGRKLSYFAFCPLIIGEVPQPAIGDIEGLILPFCPLIIGEVPQPGAGHAQGCGKPSVPSSSGKSLNCLWEVGSPLSFCPLIIGEVPQPKAAVAHELANK